MVKSIYDIFMRKELKKEHGDIRENWDRNDTLTAGMFGLIILWIFAMYSLILYWKELPTWAKVLGVIGILPIVPFGPLITIFVIYAIILGK